MIIEWLDSVSYEVVAAHRHEIADYYVRELLVHVSEGAEDTYAWSNCKRHF